MPSRPVRALVLLVAGLVVGLVASGLATAPATASPAPDGVAERSAPYRIEPFVPRRSDDDRLVRRWQTWRAQGLTRYQTSVRRSCECIERPPIRTTVEGRRVTSVRYEGGRELGRHGWEVAALYRLLRRGYAEADAVTVRWRRDGVPRSIVVDWDEDIADEETVLSVRLVPAPPAVERQQPAAPGAPYAVRPFRTRASDPDRLARAWRAWRERHPARYVTVVQLSCFCAPIRPVRTEVAGRRVVSVRHAGRARELRRPGYEMPALYRMLRDAYARADDVQVRFHRGVPRSIAIDFDERMSDEEAYYTVRLRTPKP